MNWGRNQLRHEVRSPSRLCAHVAATQRADRPLHRREAPHSAPAPFPQQMREPGGQFGPRPVAADTASGNLAGCAVASVTIGVRLGQPRLQAAAPPRARPRCADRSDSPWRACVSRIAAAASSSSTRALRNSSPARARAAGGSVICPPASNPAIAARSRCGIAVQQIEQQPLEIGADLDVHRGRPRRRHRPRANNPPALNARCRMSFTFVATISRSIGSPMRAAT